MSSELAARAPVHIQDLSMVIFKRFISKLLRGLDILDFALILNALKHLPVPVAEWLSNIRGQVRYAFDLDWRSTSIGYPFVRGNTLKAYNSFTGSPDNHKKARERFIHQSREELEAKFISCGKKQWPAKVVYENLASLNKVRQEGRGLILLAAHFDSSVAGSAFLGDLGFDVNIFYDDIVYDGRVPMTFQKFFREKYKAMQTHYNKGTFISRRNIREIYPRLMKGEIFILMSDVLNVSGTLSVEFLKQRYEASDKALRLALKNGAYIGAYVTVWEGHGSYRTILSDPVLPSQAMDPNYAIQKCYTFLSEFILKAPERWWVADTLVGFKPQ